MADKYDVHYEGDGKFTVEPARDDGCLKFVLGVILVALLLALALLSVFGDVTEAIWTLLFNNADSKATEDATHTVLSTVWLLFVYVGVPLLVFLGIRRAKRKKEASAK